MYKLRDYQTYAVEKGVENLTKKNPKPFVLQLATGAGKSIVIADIVDRLQAKVLVLQPQKELVEQNYQKMVSYNPSFDVGVYCAGLGRKEIMQVTYATIHSIYRKPELFKDFEYVIVDECFVAGTKVDGRDIETIKPGDKVTSFNHSTSKTEQRTVTAVSKKKMQSNMYSIDTPSGSIISTYNHPHYVKGVGYVYASEIRKGDTLFGLREQDNRADQEPKSGSSTVGQGLLFDKLQQKSTRETVLDTHEGKQPNAIGGDSFKDVRNSKKDRTQTDSTRREWNRAISTSTNTLGETWSWLDNRATDTNNGEENKPWSLSHILQSRHWKRNFNASDRGARKYTLQSSDKGLKEATEVRELRVDSVRVLEQADIERLGLSDEGNWVYNLEVEHNDNFFANGVLTHNCHQIDPAGFDDGKGKRKKKPGMYASFFEELGITRICGLTATPYRLDQKFFYEDGQKYYTSHLKMINRVFPYFFKSIVCKVETDQLIKRGYLSPILYRHVDIGNMNELKLNSQRSEYDAESLVQFWRNDRRLQKLADCIAKIDQYCQRNLVFCSSLLQARRAKEMLATMGIRVEMVSGDTPAAERAELVKAYRNGDFKHMLNVGVFTTGFDVPELDCVVLARPTLSLALYYQMVGRGVRLDPKRPEKKLRVYDLVRLSEKLGRVETIKVVKELDPDTGKPTWKDEVRSEAGVMTNVPLFKFRVNK